jgi:hypothetical protein
MRSAFNAIGHALIEFGDWLNMPVLTGLLYRIGAKLELME